MRATAAGAQAHGRWVGVCGELAGDPAAAVLLAGLGVTELSMAPALDPRGQGGAALGLARATPAPRRRRRWRRPTPRPRGRRASALLDR